MPRDKHIVEFVNDEALPPDQDWLMLEVDGKTYCIVRSSKICPEVLEDAWAGYRKLADDSRVSLDGEDARCWRTRSTRFGSTFNVGQLLLILAAVYAD